MTIEDVGSCRGFKLADEAGRAAYCRGRDPGMAYASTDVIPEWCRSMQTVDSFGWVGGGKPSHQST